MRKIILLGLMTFITINTFGQSLTKLSFEEINNKLRNIISSINSEKDFDLLIEQFGLTEEQSKLLLEIKENEKLEFNKGPKLTRNFILPFYMESDMNNRLFLTIYAVNNEDFHSGKKNIRGKYSFVLECVVGLNKTYNLVFENVNLMTDKLKIQKWFLDGHKDYVKNTVPIVSVRLTHLD